MPRSQDCVSQLIAGLVTAVWWFHPLVWYAADRMRALGEEAADDCVIRAGTRRVRYAAQLLAIASSLGWLRIPSPTRALFGRSHFERRLRAILDPARHRNPLEGEGSLAGLLVACWLMIPLATATPTMIRQTPNPAAPVRINIHMRMHTNPASVETENTAGTSQDDGSSEVANALTEPDSDWCKG